jgi:hypothetical protein
MPWLAETTAVVTLVETSKPPEHVRSAQLAELNQVLPDGEVARKYREIDISIVRIDRREQPYFYYRVQFSVNVTRWSVFHVTRGLDFELRKANHVLEPWHHPLAWTPRLNEWFPKSLEGTLHPLDFALADNVRIVLLGEEVYR